jgi:hypothetical protein
MWRLGTGSRRDAFEGLPLFLRLDRRAGDGRGEVALREDALLGRALDLSGVQVGGFRRSRACRGGRGAASADQRRAGKGSEPNAGASTNRDDTGE